MRLSLVRIGNSRGIRLPKTLIEEAGLQKELEAEVQDGMLVIRPVRNVRTGWAEDAVACHRQEEDGLSDWDAVDLDWESDA